LEVMRAVSPLYESTRDWEKLIGVSERILEQAEDQKERYELMLDISEIAEQHLQDPKRAFEWIRRAYVERPDADSLERVELAAERHGLYEELISVYQASRDRSSDPLEQIAASRKIASICEDQLHDPRRAFAVLRDALPADPA